MHLVNVRVGRQPQNYSSHNCSYQQLLHAVLTRVVGTKKVTRSYTPEHCANYISRKFNVVTSLHTSLILWIVKSQHQIGYKGMDVKPEIVS